MSVKTLLQGIEFVDRLSKEQLSDLIRIAEAKEWESNRAIFAEGDPPDNLYLILSGKVRISKKDAKGEELTLAQLVKGDFFGEMALMDGAPRSASATTTEPCEFLVVSRKAVSELLDRSPRLIPGLFGSIVGKLRSLNENFLTEVVEKQRLTLEMERERHRSIAQIAAISNEAFSIEEAMKIAVNQVCAYTGWPVGHVCAASEDSEDDLYSLSVWHLQDPERYEPFQKLTEMSHFSSGVGLPGAVLANRAAVWIEDLSQGPECSRSKVAEMCGLRSAYGIPVLVEKRVAAVLEFFSDQLQKQDVPLLDSLAQVGYQLGRVIERKRYEEQLVHNAFHDPLTDLPNRKLLLDRLSFSVSRGKRDKNYLFAVVFIDLDHFKLINDSLGHLAGDQLLREVTSRLQTCVRAVDTVARVGGDEFVLLLDDVQHWSNVTRVLERTKKKLQIPFRLAGREVVPLGSMGIALSAPHYEHAEELLRDADTAMYRAKAQGRGRYEVFEPSMHKHAVEALHVQSELRRALDQQQLLAYFQPVVSIENARIIGFEALLRWRHPQRGLLLPQDFLTIAEDTELILPITQWMLQEACSRLKRLQNRFPSPLPLHVSVNLSAKFLSKPTLVREISAAVSRNGLKPSNLRLEITEDQIMDHPESVSQALLQLDAAGIHTFIDDFGIGYSSFGYLSRLPVRGLKIDRSFIKNVDRDQKNAAIVRSTVSLGENLGLEVIAEGAETAEELNYLREINCQFVQGFYYSQPLDSDGMDRILQEGLSANRGK